MKCAVKRGIITLRDCGNEGSDMCAVCTRPMCQEHTRIRGAELLCVECFAKQEEQKKVETTTKPAKGQQQPARQNEWEDESWPYSYRHHYYTTYHYSPFYTGSYYGGYYSDYDVRSFENTGQDMVGDDEAGGGFYDS
jgi:hypothetical protein